MTGTWRSAWWKVLRKFRALIGRSPTEDNTIGEQERRMKENLERRQQEIQSRLQAAESEARVKGRKFLVIEERRGHPRHG